MVAMSVCAAASAAAASASASAASASASAASASASASAASASASAAAAAAAAAAGKRGWGAACAAPAFVARGGAAPGGCGVGGDARPRARGSPDSGRRCSWAHQAMAAACEKKSGTFAVSRVLPPPPLKAALLQRARARAGSWLLGVKAHAPGGACTQTSSLLRPLSPLFGSG